MNNRIIIFFLALSFLVQSCYKDDTSGVNRELSNIQVNLGFQDKATIDLLLNEEYSLSPQIEQNNNLPLTYEWEIDYKVVSTEKDLTYTGSRLGTFPVRLKVSNEDGSTYKEFTIRVNSQYEEGLMILGEDASQEGTLSFIPKHANKLLSQTLVSDVDINSFETNNPGLKLGQKPTDVAVRLNQVFISSEEGGISMLNYKTLELEGVVRSPDFPDFKPVIMNIQDNASRSALIQSRNGKIFSLATLEFIISNHTASRNAILDLKSQYTLNLNFTNNFFWEAENSRLWNFRNTAVNTGTTLAGQNIIHFFATGGSCYVLTSDQTTSSSLTLTKYPEELVLNPPPTYAPVLTISRVRKWTDNNPLLTPTAKTLLVGDLGYVVYTNGNKLYKWYFEDGELTKTPFITLDIPGEIISMEKDPANKEMYVAVSDVNATGLKGSVLVYDLETGAKKATFANIADKPVKIFFKKRK